MLKIFILTALVCIAIAEDEYDNYEEKYSEIEQRSDQIKLRICFVDKDCLPNEFCESKFRSIRKKCRMKISDNLNCLYDNYCISNHCHRSKCLGNQVGNDVSYNGSCGKNEDCRFDQYCVKLKCVNRKKKGFCFKDGQCLSNYCKFLHCKI
jgi:hypothetical protein